MSIENIKKIKQELKQEYNKNQEKINILDEKIKTINANNFETKAMLALAFSFLSWFAFMLSISTIIKYIPVNLIQSLITGTSILIGITVEKISIRKAKCRERLRKFSTAKKQKELIEESTRYEIEKEKIISLNKIIEKCYEKLSENEENICFLSENYTITEKDTNNKTVEEITTNIENKNNILIKQQQDINVITTKCVLANKFWRVRDKAQRFNDMFLSICFGGAGCMFTYNMPIIRNPQLFQASSFSIYIPLVIGGLVGGIYVSKRKKTHSAIFNQLNKELKDNAISKFRDYEEDKQFEKDLENLITNVSETLLELEAQKIQLPHNILDEEYQRPIVTQETIDFIKSHPEMHANCPIRVQMGNIYTDGEFEKRSNEVLSKELPGEEEAITRKRSLFPNKK